MTDMGHKRKPGQGPDSIPWREHPHAKGPGAAIMVEFTQAAPSLRGRKWKMRGGLLPEPPRMI